jgi:S1-C subfamily serine protease
MNATERAAAFTARKAGYLFGALGLLVSSVPPHDGYAATVLVFGASRAPAHRDVAAYETALGITIEVLQSAQLSGLGVAFGLKVENVDAAIAQDTLLGRGDVILQINHIRVSSLAQFKRILREQQPGEWISLLVERDGVPMYVDAKVRG